MRWVTTRSSIIARLRDPQDDGAWRTFDRLYGEVMVRYGIRRGLSFEDAEDVRQIVLTALARSMPRFEFCRDRGRFRSYLGRVLGNAIQRHRRGAHHAREWLTPDLEPFDRGVEAAELDAQWEDEWTRHHLRRALQALRASARPASIEVFELLLDGVAPERIARDQHTSVEAVYKLQQRLRARLRVIVRRQMSEEAEALERLPMREVS